MQPTNQKGTGELNTALRFRRAFIFTNVQRRKMSCTNLVFVTFLAFFVCFRLLPVKGGQVFKLGKRMKLSNEYSLLN